MAFFEAGLGAGRRCSTSSRPRSAATGGGCCSTSWSCTARRRARWPGPGSRLARDAGERLRAAATGSTCCASCPGPPASRPSGEIDAVARFAAPGNPAFLVEGGAHSTSARPATRARRRRSCRSSARGRRELEREDLDEAAREEGLASLDRIASALARQGGAERLARPRRARAVRRPRARGHDRRASPSWARTTSPRSPEVVETLVSDDPRRPAARRARPARGPQGPRPAGARRRARRHAHPGGPRAARGGAQALRRAGGRPGRGARARGPRRRPRRPRRWPATRASSTPTASRRCSTASRRARPPARSTCCRRRAAAPRPRSASRTAARSPRAGRTARARRPSTSSSSGRSRATTPSTPPRPRPPAAAPSPSSATLVKEGVRRARELQRTSAVVPGGAAARGDGRGARARSSTSRTTT